MKKTSRLASLAAAALGAGIAVMAAGFAVFPAGFAGAQSANWYPSRWGAADQRGAANRITPAKVLEAKNLITRGTVYRVIQQI
jgi:hypothetical protein